MHLSTRALCFVPAMSFLSISCSRAQPRDETAASQRSATANAATTPVADSLPNCQAFPAQSGSPFVLPYEVGTEHLVWRTTEHFARGNGGVGLYAIDFEMPIGTPVVAARAGEVVAARDSFPDVNGKDLEENFVFIRHDDSTIARYFHLKQGGVRVGPGARIEQGQVIGLSGNSGESTGPHLHFDVQQCGPNLPPSYNRMPCGQTLPASFRNTERHDCGLMSGRRYRAR